MTTPSTTRSGLIADRLAKAMQDAREEIGATEQQRIAFAYAEAAMRHELPAALTPNPDDALREALEEAREALRGVLDSCQGEKVAGGDGGTYVVRPPTRGAWNRALNAARMADAALASTRCGEAAAPLVEKPE